MDAIVAKPITFSAKEKKSATEYVYLLYNQLLPEMASALNSYHKKNHSVRYWNILLGYWLQRYISLIYNRYATIKQVFQNYEISGVTLCNDQTYSLATQTSSSFLLAADDDRWNLCLYSKIIRFLGNACSCSETIPADSQICFGQEELIKAPKPELSRSNMIGNLIRRIIPHFRKHNDAVIINTYLPRWQEVELQFRLGQFPQLWTSPPLGCAEIDTELRQGLQVESGNGAGFEQLARLLLWEVLPVCYLEGYPAIVEQVNNLPLPENPKFVFTANNFDTDEIFKAWIGKKVECGTPYFAGQHGNHYGTHVESGRWPEQITCDKFFTWGWSNNSDKDVPAFVFKLAGRKKANDPKGGLLLVEVCQSHRFELEDSANQFGVYLEDQFRFVRALPQEIRASLTVRLHSGSRYFAWDEEDRWSDFDPSVAVEKGAVPIDNLIAKNRLIVHSYDSTGILETLASNVPTMCFWQGGLSHLLPSAKPYYEQLRDVGILADSPEQAAINVASCWESVETWWFSEKVQNARKDFCAQYARTTEHPVREMKRLLTSQSRLINKSL